MRGACGDRGASDGRRSPASDKAAARRSAPEVAAQRKLSFKEQREFESLPARIEALEEEQRRLTEESVAPDFYKSGGDHISGVLARIERIAAEHEAALARWLELEERAVPRP